MKKTRAGALVAIATAGTLFLAGCTGGGSSETGQSESGEIQSGTSVTAVQNAPTTALNSFTTTNYSTYNSNVQYFTQAGFNYYDADQKLVKNTKLGTYEKLSDSPLTIKYTLNKDVTWSDGQPITATDILLYWAANLTKYNDPKGVNFDGIGQGSGYDYVTKMPTIGDDGRSVTFVYSKPYVDWEIAGTAPNLPAHVLWQEAYPDQKVTATQAAANVLKAIQDGDTTALKALGSAYANKWTVDSMPSDKKLLVSSGAYVVSSFVKDQYITLTARKDYKAGPQPKVAKFTMRFITDPTAQVQALQNGEVSLLYGQATSDTVKALQGIGKGFTTTTSPEASYEHIDLNLKKGVFSPSSYGGDTAKALKVRQAFFTAMPRQEMLERIIKPLSSDAKLDDSQLFLPGGEGYDGAVKLGDYADYQTADASKAKQLLQAAGVKTPVTVKFAYATDNPRRVQEFQLIQAAMKDAGFNVTDVGVPAATFFGDKGIAGDTYQYDASVFAYVLSSLSVGSSQGNTTCGNPYNYNGYCNKETDALWQKATQASSYSAAVPYMQQIDANIIKDAASITLYQLPDVSAWDSRIQNVKNAPLTPNIFWNYFDWSIAK